MEKFESHLETDLCPLNILKHFVHSQHICLKKTEKETCLFFVLCKNESTILNKKKPTDRMNRRLI